MYLTVAKGRKIALSFKDAAEKYLARLEEEDGKDLAAKRRRLDQHLVGFFGQTPVAKISTFDVEGYKKQRLSENNLLCPRGKLVARSPEKMTTAKRGTINRELAVPARAEAWR